MKKAHYLVRLFCVFLCAFFGSGYRYLRMLRCILRRLLLEIKSFCIHLFDTDFDKLVNFVLFSNKIEYMEIS
ncbi:MAG: hypothetical protein RL331_270 [Bacteroidota bacterium]|jgi:hypothetical protein